MDVFSGPKRIGTSLVLKQDFYALTFLSWQSAEHIQMTLKMASHKED